MLGGVPQIHPPRFYAYGIIGCRTLKRSLMFCITWCFILTDRHWIRTKRNFAFLSVKHWIIYLKKFLESDWLRAVQFQGNTVQKKGNKVICIQLPSSGTVLHSSCILLTGNCMMSRTLRKKYAVVSFSKSSNSIRPSDPCYFDNLWKSQPCEFFSKLHSKPYAITYANSNHVRPIILTISQKTFVTVERTTSYLSRKI